MVIDIDGTYIKLTRKALYLLWHRQLKIKKREVTELSNKIIKKSRPVRGTGSTSLIRWDSTVGSECVEIVKAEINNFSNKTIPSGE